MTTKNVRRWLSPSLYSLILILLYKPCTSKNRNLGKIAIQFTVHQHDSYNETLEDVRAKAKLVSSQFQGVFSFGVMARDGTVKQDYSAYNFGSTYNQSFPQVYAGEAVGLVNAEGSSPIVIFIGIHPHIDDNLFKKEVELARQSALIAEKSKLNTVKGFVLDFKDLPLNLEKINTAIEMIHSSEPFKFASFGLRLNCDTILKDNVNISKLVLKMHRNMRFLLCVKHANISLQGKHAFEHVATVFKTVNATMHKELPLLNLIGQTGIPARGNVKEDVKNLEEFWEAAEAWVTENDFLMVMTEAFDNPWRKWDDTQQHEGNFGWWSVSKNNGNGKFNVFKQKDPALVPDRVSTTTCKPAGGSTKSGSHVIASFENAFSIFGMILMRYVF